MDFLPNAPPPKKRKKSYLDCPPPSLPPLLLETVWAAHLVCYTAGVIVHWLLIGFLSAFPSEN